MSGTPVHTARHRIAGTTLAGTLRGHRETLLPNTARLESNAWHGRAPLRHRQRWVYCFPNDMPPHTLHSPCSDPDRRPFPTHVAPYISSQLSVFVGVLPHLSGK